MQADFFEMLNRAISQERLDGYTRRREKMGPESIYAHYAWNLALSESLYPALQGVEIALRNSLQAAMTKRYGCEEWFNDRNLLHERDCLSVAAAQQTLIKAGKAVDPSRVVAELGFGFWTSLFDVRYEQRFWPWLLKPVFPYMPRTLRTRAELSRRLNRVRFLRNRVFHHEPIWYWKDLERQQRELVKVVFWINPAMAKFVSSLDRFPAIAVTGCAPYHTLMESLALQESRS